MANLIIKPSAGGDLKLQDEGGTDAISISTTGNTTLAGAANNLGTVTAGVWSGTRIAIDKGGSKWHSFEMATRTAGVSAAGNQFAFTGTFTPLDPVNNSFWVECNIPIYSAQQGACGIGLKFDGTTDYSAFGKGVRYVYHGTNNMAIMGMSFNIPASAISAGSYTIYLATEIINSQPVYYCPNSTDDSRISTATRATLMITEYNNG